MHQIHVGRYPAYLAELVSRQQKTVVDLVYVQQAQAPAATRNPDCVQNSLNVLSLSPDLQNGTVCRMTFG